MTKTTLIGEGIGFTHIARITGYLARTDRFNSAKLSEVRERVKHSISNGEPCKCAA